VVRLRSRHVRAAMSSIKFHGEVALRSRRKASMRRILFFVFSLLIATLACSRADVPVQDVEGTSELTEDTQVDPAHTVEPLSNPVATAIPSTTVTPSKPEPLITPTYPPTPTIQVVDEIEQVLYTAQPGDTLHTVALHFAVLPEDITSPDPLPDSRALIDPGQLLVIPSRLRGTGPSTWLIPDSELVFSPHVTDFDVTAFVAQYGGYLTRYREYVGTKWHYGPEIVALSARDHSVNPRLLLALLEYESGWVTNPTAPTGDAFNYPLGYKEPQATGLFRQLAWLCNELGNGYYGWRSGMLTELRLKDGSTVRLAPALNAGTVALQYYFAVDHDADAWEGNLGLDGFMAIYSEFFGDPWAYQYPLYEPEVEQPEMILPFMRGQVWAFTGGPHGAWERDSAWAALDFAPAATESGCVVSDTWSVAAAPGVVVRSGDGVVVLDLDGDGREQSGWALLYLHIAERGRVEEGVLLEAGDRIGHPSCEGGIATGTHIHIARKYNGEWILADGPLPFTLSGWVARAGAKPYMGALVKGNEVVLACSCATQETLISR
jgi:LasA protease